MIDALVKEAKKGSKSAFEQLIIYYKNDLYNIARTRLMQIDDIEDAVQETIISAYQSIHKLRNVSKFKSWLITILINKCNYIYKQKNITQVSFEAINGENYLLQESKYDSNIEFDNLLNILDRDEKTVILLYYSEGYNSKEISKMLNINDSTIRNIISRAKNKIKNQLKEVKNYG